MTQAEWILEQLQSGRKLTPMDAIAEYGCTKLATRIGELKALGYDIKGILTSGYNRHGKKCNYNKYWIEQPEQGQLI